MPKKLQPALVLLATLAIVATTTTVNSQMANNGGEQIKFPADLGTMYLSFDRSDNKQLREYYATPRLRRASLCPQARCSRAYCSRPSPILKAIPRRGTTAVSSRMG